MEKLKNTKEENRLSYLLFGVKEWEKISKMLYRLWHLRKILLKPPQIKTGATVETSVALEGWKNTRHSQYEVHAQQGPCHPRNSI